MIERYVRQSEGKYAIDIHGGGADLLFPHHENEAAQTRCATNHELAKYWMHNGFVRINGDKIGKSLGNSFTIREVLKNYHPESIRLFILSSHYRSPLNYSEQNVLDANSSLTRLYTAIRGIDPTTNTVVEQQYVAKFMSAMDDDFNTPLAISVLFELVKELNKSTDTNIKQNLAATLKYLGGLLGILHTDPEKFLQGTATDSVSKIEQLIEERKASRLNKRWKDADVIRCQLHDMGIILEDCVNGETIWRRVI
jgi:cysteinyl-tRNA synthetase